MPEFVLVEKHGVRGELILNRPDRRNALIGPMMDEMRQAILALTEDSEVNVVLIRGAGGTFCAGMDLDARKQVPPPDWLRTSGQSWAAFHAALWACPKPVVGAVERAAIAGGSALCFACDFIIAGQNARIGATEARMGVSAPVNLAWLTARWGYNTAVQVTTSAKLFGGEDLHRMGIAYRWAPDDDVLAVARSLADELGENSVQAMMTLKRSAQRLSGIDFEALLRQAQGQA